MRLWPSHDNNRLDSRSKTRSLKGKRPDHKLHTGTYMCTYTKVQNKTNSYKQAPRNTCHARPGKYYISGVLTVSQTLSDAQSVLYWMDFNSKAPTYPCGESARFWEETSSLIQPVLPKEKYGAAQPDIKMLYPFDRSVTNNCARQHLQFEDCAKNNKSVQRSARCT